MNDFLNITAYLSTLMLLGLIIKNKIKFIQNLFIPSSIIGGLVGLFLSSNILGKYFLIIPSSWEIILRSIPGVLIIPILVSIPLGMKFEKSTKLMKNTVNTAGILFLVTFVQLLLGYIINFIFDKILKIKLYKSFGAELNSAFAGGHGTSGVVARTLKELGADYWELAQGVTVTLATLGLVLGILFGIFQIKFKSKTKLRDSVLKEYSQGYIKDKEKQLSFGKETMLSTSLDTLSYHLAIIFGVSGISILTLNIFKSYNIPILSKITVWSYGMVLMFIVWKILNIKKAEWSIDVKVKSKITATLIDFSITAAVATIPLRGVMNYIFPILLISTLGFVITWLVISKLSKRYFKDYELERTLSIFGTSTGVFITGLILLRICDPKLETPVLQDYSLGFSITALLGPILIVFCIQLSYLYNYFYPMWFLLILIALTTFFLEYYNRRVDV
ncbi:sodium/glutamate symporter [Cetobacterium sp.]|uniref:sodium/glutamate symporter n=1 Tax=Cetobacterium sp. TaxID=2071632 RepID=UPI003F2D7C82